MVNIRVSTHLDTQEAWQVEQRLLLTKVVLLLSEVNGRAYSIEEAMFFSFRDWIEVHYEVCLCR